MKNRHSENSLAIKTANHRLKGEAPIDIKPTLWKAEYVVAQMDDVVDKVANRHKWESIADAVYKNLK